VIEYNRDDSKLHNATSIIIISNLIAWLILCIDIIAILISEKYRVVMVVVAIIILAYGIFCDLYYNYQEMCSIKIVKDREKDNKNKIVYQYRLNDTNIIEYLPYDNFRYSLLGNYESYAKLDVEMYFIPIWMDYDKTICEDSSRLLYLLNTFSRQHLKSKLSKSLLFYIMG